MTDETPSPWWVPGHLLECLHRAGFTVSARDGKVVVSPESELDDTLRADIERHHDAFAALSEVERERLFWITYELPTRVEVRAMLHARHHGEGALPGGMTFDLFVVDALGFRHPIAEALKAIHRWYPDDRRGGAGPKTATE